MEVDDLGNEQRPTRGHLFAVGVEQMDFAGCVESDEPAATITAHRMAWVRGSMGSRKTCSAERTRPRKNREERA